MAVAIRYWLFSNQNGGRLDAATAEAFVSAIEATSCPLVQVIDISGDGEGIRYWSCRRCG